MWPPDTERDARSPSDPGRGEPLDKGAVVEALRHRLAQELEAVERVAAMARDEVASEQAKSEGKYDTRATEASYLARGQAFRVAGLRRLRAWFEVFDPGERASSVRLGSLVHLGGHREAWVFVAPEGGPRITVSGRAVRVISPRSPLGQALLEAEREDLVEVDSPQGLVEYEILSVS